MNEQEKVVSEGTPLGCWEAIAKLVAPPAVLNPLSSIRDEDVVKPHFDTDLHIPYENISDDHFGIGSTLPLGDRAELRNVGYGELRARTMLLRLNSNIAAFWHLIGECYFDNGELGKAKVCFRRAIAIDPDLKQGWGRKRKLSDMFERKILDLVHG